MPKGHDVIHAGGGYQPHPVVAVNRLRRFETTNDVRVRNAPVVVAGSRIAPLRPISPRPFYDHATGGERAPSVHPGGGVRYGYVQPTNTTEGNRSVYWNTMPRPSGGPAFRAPANAGGTVNRPAGGWVARPAPPSRSFGGGGGVSRPSGGGGGGASHSFGGGGGSRPSGGGGGGGAPHGGGSAPHR